MRAPGWIVALAALGAVAAQAQTPPAAPLTPRQAEGQALFGKTCAYCHGEHGFAARDLGARLGPDKAFIARRNDLDAAYIRFVIRHGQGNMPAYTPTDLSRDQIEAVVAYLTRNKTEAHRLWRLSGS